MSDAGASAAPAPQRVVIADDHALFRAGLRSLVDALPDATVVAEVDTGTRVLDTLREHRPDLLLLDQNLPGINGLELLSRADFPNALRVVVLTGIRAEAVIAEAVASRADAVVSKNDDPRVITQALRAVLDGKTFYSADINELAGRAGLLQTLTPRELQTLRLIGSGNRNKAIAEQLGVSVKTVDAHRTNLMRKLDMHSAAELMDYAITMGLREQS